MMTNTKTDEKNIIIGLAISNFLERLEEKDSIHIFRHVKGLKIKCNFSKNKEYRYCLCAEKKGVANGKKVCVIMQNPSYANKYIADKSINFFEKVLFQKNMPVGDVQKMTVVNLFSKIKTNNFRVKDEGVLEGAKNKSFVEKAVGEANVIIIGWGCEKKKFIKRKKEISQVINNCGAKIYKTQKHPSKHPKLIKKELKKFIKSCNDCISL